MKNLEDLLKVKIKRPFGIFLSGGIDSGILAALLKPDYAITCSFDPRQEGEKYSELSSAIEIAGHLKIPLTILVPQKVNVKLDFEDAVNIIGKPIGSVSIYSWYQIMKKASELGFKRMVGGEGGDELFGGYARYIILDKVAEMYRSEELKHYKPMLDKIFGSINKLHEFIVGSTKTSEFPQTDVISHIGKWEYENTLPDIVLMEKQLAKHFGIDLYLPFMQKSVKDFALKLPEKDKIRGYLTKVHLRDIANKYLPYHIAFRKHKQGFISPILKWLELEGDYEFDKNKYLEYQKEILCGNNPQKESQEK